ncbi:MAG: hypothetical protein ACHQUC_08585 [Chlamydiales bacterium]
MIRVDTVIQQSSPYSLPSTSTNSAEIINFPDFPAASSLSWEKRVVKQLEAFDNTLDGWMPNWILQRKIDALGAFIQDTFSSLTTFNSWLRSNGDGAWHAQLATYLAKLPLRAAYNIVTLLCNAIKGILYTATHPLKGLNAIAKQLILLVHSLTQPETWSKIGAGMIGAGIGQSLILSNPISVVAIGIGAACVIAGVSFGALKAAIESESSKKFEKTGHHVIQQLQQIPESFLTGFLMALLTSGIRKIMTKDREMHTQKDQIQKKQTQIKKVESSHHVTTLEEAKAYAEQFTTEHNLPPPEHINFLPLENDLAPPGTIVMTYIDVTFFRDNYPHLINGNYPGFPSLQIHLYPNGDFAFVPDNYHPGVVTPLYDD